MEANLKIATLVVQKLKDLGYTVDLLEEFDARLDQYNGMALISIHNDSCDYINDDATGFNSQVVMDMEEPLVSILQITMVSPSTTSGRLPSRSLISGIRRWITIHGRLTTFY